MKIAMLSNQGEIGGGEVMLFHVARALRELSHEPMIVGPSHQPDVLLRAREEGIPYAGIRSSNRTDYLAKLALWARRSDADLLWSNGFLPATATGGLQRRVVHLHQVPDPKLKPLVPYALRGASLVLAPSNWVSDHVPDARVFPNWTADMAPEDTASPRRSIGTHNRIRVGFLGRMTIDKGIITLVDSLSAVAETHDVELVVGGVTRFGSAQEEQLIQTALQKSPFPVDWLGWVDTRAFLSKIDVLTVPSNLGEAFGLVAAEAMSAGIPVIVSDDGGLREVVQTNYPYTFARGDTDALATTLARFIEESPASDQHQTLRDSNRTRWEELFSPAAGTARLQNIIEDLESAS